MKAKLRSSPIRTAALQFCAITVTVLLTPASAFANGGVFSASVVQRTGNLVPITAKFISLDQEKLAIRIEEGDAIVDVNYELINRGPATEVAFGFPVDVATSLPTPNGFEYVMSNSLRDFRVTDGAQTLPIERTVEKPLSADERPDGIDSKIELIRRWSVTSLKFKSGERKQIHVGYRARCVAKDEGFEGDIDWKFGVRTFFYTFRPAATWGDGHVRNVEISVDISWLREREIPYDFISPRGNSTDGDVARWSFENFDLAHAPDLRLSYDPSAFYLDRLLRKDLLPRGAMKSFNISSTLKSDRAAHYSKELMLDRNLHTAWVEGAKGTGIGESIEFEPKDNYVQGVAILNGYVANKSLYYANARIKQLRVELELSGDVDPAHQHSTYEVTLPDRKYDDLKFRYPLAMADLVVEHPHGDGVIDRVKLTILDVYPGREYADCAIAELYVYGFEYKKP
jgi:hypothetical protein